MVIEDATAAVNLPHNLRAGKVDPSVGGKWSFLPWIVQTFSEEHITSDVDSISIYGRVILIHKSSSFAVEIATDLCADEAHFALGYEAVPEEHIARDFKSVGVEGRALFVAEDATAAVKLIVDLRADQVHFTIGRETTTEPHGTLDIGVIGA